MRFAIVDGKKTEASKGAIGLCPRCCLPVLAKCGEVKVHHWAHRGNRTCDPWWENETAWHRSWKGNFPTDWQEVIHSNHNGDKHIADVKTEHGWAIEFQHSFLNPDERRTRDTFYTKLVWVVDGLRRARDKLQFNDALKGAVAVFNSPLILRLTLPVECRLLKEWSTCNAPVFFDFQDANASGDSALWLLYPKTNCEVYLSPFSRNKFIEFHHDNRFDEMATNIILAIRDVLAGPQRTSVAIAQNSRPNRLPYFGPYLSRRRRRL